MHSAQSEMNCQDKRATSVIRSSKILHQVGFGHFQWHPPAKLQTKNDFINTLQKYEKEDTWKLAVLTVPLQNLHVIWKKVWGCIYFFFQGQSNSSLDLNDLFPKFYFDGNTVHLEIMLDSKGWGEISIWKTTSLQGLLWLTAWKYQRLLLLNRRAWPALCCHMELQLAPMCRLDSLQPCTSMSSPLSSHFQVDCDTDRSPPVTRCLACLFTYRSLHVYKR